MKDLYTVREPKTTSEMSWKEAEAILKDTDIAILVVGATEQHGPHNPMGVDTIAPLDMAKRASQLLEKKGIKVLLTTPIPFGMSQHHLRFPGSISLQPETLEHLIFDIGTSLADQGVNKLVMIVGHTSVEQEGCCAHAAVHLQSKYGMMTGIFQWSRELNSLIRENPGLKGMAKGFDAHSGEGETAFMLAIAPNLVDRNAMVVSITKEAEERYRNPTTSTLRRGGHPGVKSGLMVPVPGPMEYSVKSLGHVGDPTVATAELGNARLDALAGKLAELVERMTVLDKKWKHVG